jgi:nicotinate-nucleotide adenylyltransferase
VQQAREIWQDAEFTLVVGTDLVRQLPSWYRADELLQQVKVLVVPRPRFSLPDRDLDELRNRGVDVAIAAIDVPIVSSSAYRNNGDKSGIIPSVAAYIEQEHLYGCQEAKNAIH